MKKNIPYVICLILLGLVIGLVFADATSWDIKRKPNEKWLSGSVGDPAWNWMKEIDKLVSIGPNPGTGQIFYVDSGVTTAGNGTSWENAVATLDAGVNLCTANRGDVIFVAQGHAENLSGADGVDVDIAGVTIIGLGNGDLRPTFSYTNGAGEFVLGAAGDNSSIHNLRFIATVDSVVKAIDVEAACVGWGIYNCEFSAETTTTDEFDDVIIIGAAADKGVIQGCRFLGDPGSNADPQSCINFVDCDYLVIRNNEFFGDRAVACIENHTTASNFIIIENNILFNGIIGGSAGLNGQPVIELVATTTGVVRKNAMVCNLATVAAAIVGDDMFTYENYYNEDDGGDADAIVTGAAVSVTATADD